MAVGGRQMMRMFSEAPISLDGISKDVQPQPKDVLYKEKEIAAAAFPEAARIKKLFGSE